MGYVSRGIDKARDGYAAVVGRLVRVAVVGLVLLAAIVFGIVDRRRSDADGLPAAGGPGRLLRRAEAAGGRLGQSHRAVAMQVEEAIEPPARRSDYVSTVIGFSQLDGLAQSNSAFFIVTLEALRRSARQPRRQVNGTARRRAARDRRRRGDR